ncbi:MAG: bifunctional D-glycero-beta-D-manno-heptose-7-phosphate kinase/D-glycero-beta-D-manno-heptose 1-phosphate adenylyltransferase HldE, partial [Gammaproteobacteria bacterium]|nr:bifunctional D-glycero-beta-D-manno-heptose-7-phosphate kinase/D-glycero-beta-D-manno-heptose 1-phosphate adenylyltransferase HldE [Gammaproteobacteria bacterium]
LIIGDVMLDRYWYGATSRVSPEAPVPVVHIQDVEERPGGAGNVAINIAALGAPVTLVGVVGNDEAAATLEALLRAQGVDCQLERRPGRATITKLRVLSRHQQLIRLDFEDAVTGGEVQEASGESLFPMEDARVVVLSDYGKGALGEIRRIIQQAREMGLPVLVDPKGSDFSRYRGATLITPNLTEFEAVVGECQDLDVLVSKGEELCRKLQLEALLITRSEHGMTLVRQGVAAVHLPAQAREVFDVTGAGDTVIGTVAAALAAGQDLPMATALANVAAGLVVGKLGTASVAVPELQGALHEHSFSGRGVLEEDVLVKAVVDARANGETVVMTNGCFDILHAGHVRYLTQARALGDRLVVAVNDDASVKRLKGHDRPINPLSRRMAVLDAL